MVTNPLRMLRSGQPVPGINIRSRSASVASTFQPKQNDSTRNSVPDNLHNTRQGNGIL